MKPGCIVQEKKWHPMKLFGIDFALKLSLICLFIFNAINLYEIDVNYAGFITNEWLINYEGGLIRRGLFGQVVLTLFKITHIPPWIFVWSMQMMLYAAIYFFSSKKIEKGISLLAIAIFASPVSFFFEFHDPGILGRKELVFIVILAINGCILDSFYKNKSLDIKYYLIISLFFAVSILNHEVSFFVIPIFFLQIICFKKFEKSPLIFLPLGISVLTFFLVYVHHGSDKEFQEIIRSIGDFIKIQEDCHRHSGAICYIKASKEEAILDTIQPGFQFSFVMAEIIIILHAIIFLLIIGKSANYYSKPQSMAIGLLLMVSIIFLTPLFFVAIDYGRWIRLFVVSLFFSIPTVLLKDRHFKRDQFRLPLIILMIFLCISWNYPHTRSSSIEFGIWQKQDNLWENLYKKLEGTHFKTVGSTRTWKACGLSTKIGKATSGCEMEKSDNLLSGYLTFGPGERLPVGNYYFEISYASALGKNDVVGDWDVALILTKEIKILKSGLITGSNNVSKKITGEFALSSEQDMGKIEIRTLARPNVDLKIIYLQVNRVQ